MILLSLDYLEGGLQLSGCSCEQKLNDDAEWNHISHGRTISHMLTCLEEQGPRRKRNESIQFSTDRGDLVGK